MAVINYTVSVYCYIYKTGIGFKFTKFILFNCCNRLLFRRTYKKHLIKMFWCEWRDSNSQSIMARDFKSLVYTNSTTLAWVGVYDSNVWLRLPGLSYLKFAVCTFVKIHDKCRRFPTKLTPILALPQGFEPWTHWLTANRSAYWAKEAYLVGKDLHPT